MSFELADVYRIITPDPSDAFIEQRELVVDNLVTHEALGEHFPEWVSLAFSGLSDSSAAGPGVMALIETIRKQQPSFPTDPLERELDLRVTASVALGRYVKSDVDDKAHAHAIAALVLAASNLSVEPSEPRFVSVLRHLRDASQGILDASALELRTPHDVEVSKVTGSDVTTLATSMNVALKQFENQVIDRMSVDREELQILWWVFGGHSKVLNAAYKDLGDGDAIVSSAYELANLMLTPPIPAAKDFLRSVLGGRSPTALTDFLGGTSNAALQLMVTPNTNIAALVRSRPSLLPLTWLATRVLESDRSPWESEFEKKTRIVPSLPRSPQHWAQQVFAERVAIELVS